MNWFLITAAAYFFNAIANLTDRFVLKKVIHEPSVYAFFVSGFGALLAVVFIPFASSLPKLMPFLASIGAGVAFTYGLYFMYKTLKGNTVSEVAPAIGGLTPLFALIFGFIFLKEVLSPLQLVAFFIILVGSFLVVWEGGGSIKSIESELLLVFLSALLFGASHVLAKFVFSNYEFSGGMVFRGLGSLVGALSLLISKKKRQNAIGAVRSNPAPKGKLVLLGQASAGVSFILLNYAFSLGSVALTSALSGLQYAFLFIILAVMFKTLPQPIRENVGGKTFAKKVGSMAIIALGIFLLFYP